MRFSTIWCATLALASESLLEEDLVVVDIPDVVPPKPSKEFHYNVDHFVGGKWVRRCDVRVQYVMEQYSVRLTDSPDFSASDLVSGEVTQAAAKDTFYKMRLQPSDEKFSLYASIPARLLTSVEDKHDTIELTLSPSGTPVGFNYRVRNTLGLHLFEHTVVHISEPHYALAPHVTPKKEEEQASREQQGGSFLSRYWWVILIVVVLMAAGGGEEAKK